MRYTLIVATLLLCGAAPPNGVRRLTPYPDPASLRAAWSYVQSCSGARPLPGHDLPHMTVLVSPELEEGGHHILAVWSPGDTILVDSASVGVEWVIRHELLHALLQGPPPPSPPHPLEPFAIPCHLLERQQPGARL